MENRFGRFINSSPSKVLLAAAILGSSAMACESSGQKPSVELPTSQKELLLESARSKGFGLVFIQFENNSASIETASLYLKRVDEDFKGNPEMNDQSTLTPGMLTGEETIAMKASSCDGEYTLAISINEGEYQPVPVVDEKKGISDVIFTLNEECSKDLKIILD